MWRRFIYFFFFRQRRGCARGVEVEGYLVSTRGIIFFFFFKFVGGGFWAVARGGVVVLSTRTSP